MSNINEYAKNLSPSLFFELKQAVETGRWRDGKALDRQQKAHTLQLVIAYQSLHNEHPEHFTIAKGGEIHMEKKSVLQTQFAPHDTHLLNL